MFLNKSIEKFGSGFKRIDSLCKDAGIEYLYENGQNGFKFIIKDMAIMMKEHRIKYGLMKDALDLKITELLQNI